MNREEYERNLNLLRRIEEGGNDGADIYDYEAFAKAMEEKYGQSIIELVTNYQFANQSEKRA